MKTQKSFFRSCAARSLAPEAPVNERKAVLLPWYRHILNSGSVIALGMNFDGMDRCCPWNSQYDKQWKDSDGGKFTGGGGKLSCQKSFADGAGT
jgi:hypothetical protein